MATVTHTAITVTVITDTTDAIAAVTEITKAIETMEAVVMIVDDPQMTSTLRNEGAGVSAVCRLLIDAVTSRREIYVAGTAADIRNKMPSCSTAPAAKELLNG